MRWRPIPWLRASSRRWLPLALLFVLAVASPAVPSTLQLTIQPIQVCSDDGVFCANSGRELFQAVDNKIWAQADIWLDFLDWTTFNSTSLLSSSFTSITAPGHGQNFDPLVINLWFVNQIADCGGSFGAYGCGYIDGNGVAIADSVFALWRIDSIAHELGHNLGLDHTLLPLNLLAGGGIRTIPGSIDDVYPRGEMADQLTASQIDTARNSQFLSLVPAPDDGPAQVPEPASILLVAVGLGTLAGARRKRS